jgi:hypothetical protein
MEGRFAEAGLPLQVVRCPLPTGEEVLVGYAGRDVERIDEYNHWVSP